MFFERVLEYRRRKPNPNYHNFTILNDSLSITRLNKLNCTNVTCQEVCRKKEKPPRTERNYNLVKYDRVRSSYKIIISYSAVVGSILLRISNT